MDPVQKTKKCFVIGPIGKEDSDDRTNADWVLEGIIEVALKDSAYAVARADKITNPGLITSQVINAVLGADLVVADLTGHNPNAFYELALAHMAEKRVVQMITAGQEIPFDLKDVRTVHYSRRRVEDMRKAVKELRNYVKAVEKEDPVSNPVTAARGIQKLKETADPALKLVQDLFESQRAEMAQMARRIEMLEALDILRNVRSASTPREIPPSLAEVLAGSGLSGPGWVEVTRSPTVEMLERLAKLGKKPSEPEEEKDIPR
jgi:hypothetical protein